MTDAAHKLPAPTEEDLRELEKAQAQIDEGQQRMARERQIWFITYITQTTLAACQAAATRTYIRHEDRDRPLEEACLHVANLRRIAANKKAVSFGADLYLADGERDSGGYLWDDHQSRWESDWRAMAAEMLAPEVGT